ncbi:MAG: hypothetical protein AB1555_19965, partial [Nitrospirota bacterium]
MAPGNELDLWSLSPDTGTFLVVGTMKVSADGTTVETITGGIRRTAWHFAMAVSASAVPGTNGDQSGACTQCRTGSEAGLMEGGLAQALTIPGVRTLGISRDLTLHYRSTSADVRPILPLNATLSSRAAVPATFSARLTLGGVQHGAEVYWNSSGLPETADSTSRLGLQFDAAALPTGRYPADVMLFSNYPQSSIGAALTRPLLVRNERSSPFGAGWTLLGLDRLLPQGDGTLVLAQGDGTTAVFGQSRPLVLESFNVARSFAANGISTSFVAGGVYAQARTDLLDPANFGPTGIVKRSVTFRSGLQTVTLPALEGVDVFILNRPVTELTGSEGAALEEFVQGGGALLEMRPFGGGRRQILGTTGVTQISDVDAVLTVEGLNSPLAGGPFGTVSNPFPTGSSSYYGVVGFGTILANNNSGPTLLRLAPGTLFTGLGRAILFGDSETWASGYQGGGTNLYGASTNKTLFLNALAYLVQTPGYKTPPPPPNATTSFQGPAGEVSTLVQNPDGTYTRTLKDGTTYQFNVQGFQTAVSDRNGNTTAYAYDGQGRLTTITDPAGQVTTFSYTSGLLSSIADPAGRVTQFEHDTAGNLIRVTDPASHVTAFAYDPQHRLIQKTDARGQVSQYQYDYAGRFAQVTLPTGETRKLSPSQRLAVPNVAAGEGTPATPAPLAPPVNAASFTDGNNHTTTFETDALGRVTTQTDALNRVTTIQRDAQGNPLTITRPNGAVTTMTYDAKGNLLTSTEPAIAATTTFTYEPTFNQ